MHTDKSNNQLTAPYRNFTQTIDDICNLTTEYADSVADRAFDLCLSNHGDELDALTEDFYARFSEALDDYKRSMDSLIQENFLD